jgi:hypothetical protein
MAKLNHSFNPNLQERQNSKEYELATSSFKGY